MGCAPALGCAPARYLVFFQYFGTRYSGVMETKSDQALVGVQNYLEEAAQKLKPRAPIKFHISSRTDTGVHALANAAHLDIQRAPGKAAFTGQQLVQGLNHHLRPEPIRILSAQRVPSTFHARFCALSRTYIYRLLLGCAHHSEIPVFEQDLCWAPAGGPLNIPAMREAAEFLLGTHDFSTFRSLNSENAFQNPVRTLLQLEIQPAPGFLSHHYQHREELCPNKGAVRCPRCCFSLIGALQGAGVLGGEGQGQSFPLQTGAEDGRGSGGRGPGEVGPSAHPGAAGAEGCPSFPPSRHGPTVGALPEIRGVQPGRSGHSQWPSRRGALWAELKGFLCPRGGNRPRTQPGLNKNH